MEWLVTRFAGVLLGEYKSQQRFTAQWFCLCPTEMGAAILVAIRPTPALPAMLHGITFAGQGRSAFGLNDIWDVSLRNYVIQGESPFTYLYAVGRLLANYAATPRACRHSVPQFARSPHFKAQRKEPTGVSQVGSAPPPQ